MTAAVPGAIPPRDNESATIVTAGIDAEDVDLSSDGPAVIWVVDHGMEIMADPYATLDGHHLRVTVSRRHPSFSTMGPDMLQSADILIHPDGDDEDGIARCLALLRSYPGCAMAAAGDVGRCVVVPRYAQPLRIAAELPAPVVASAVHGWIDSWWWAGRRRPLAGLLTRPVSIDYAGQRYSAAVTLAPSL